MLVSHSLSFKFYFIFSKRKWIKAANITLCVWKQSPVKRQVQSNNDCYIDREAHSTLPQHWGKQWNISASVFVTLINVSILITLFCVFITDCLTFERNQKFYFFYQIQTLAFFLKSFSCYLDVAQNNQQEFCSSWTFNSINNTNKLFFLISLQEQFSAVTNDVITVWICKAIISYWKIRKKEVQGNFFLVFWAALSSTF